MAYILNGTTLPTPVGFGREYIKRGARVQMLDGTTKEDVINVKEQYTLEFQYLTQAEVSTITGIYDLNQAVTFQVTEANLPIAQTSVLVEILSRAYNARGNEYREDITLLLTEVI